MITLNDKQQVTARAYASCSNLSVGFDCLGFAVSAYYDDVTLIKRDDDAIVIADINIKTVPYEVTKNTATIALKAMLDDLGIMQGFDVVINKGIPLCSGLGGSAASACATVVAMNGFLESPLSTQSLLEYALRGEEASSGSRHLDNVVPCLWGELTLIAGTNKPKIISLPMPELLVTCLVCDYEIKTKDAREALSADTSLSLHIKQSANLAAMVAAIYSNQLDDLSELMQDLIIEPQRAHLLPGFYDIKQAALDTGAYASSFSGAGPTMYALSSNKKSAEAIGEQMARAAKAHGVKADFFVEQISLHKPHLI